MRVFMVGDVFGAPGCQAIAALVPLLRQRWQLDAVVVNCENAAAGRGVTPALAEAMLRAGVDVLTSGNHIGQIKSIYPYMNAQPRLIRPSNDPKAAGRGSYRLKLSQGRSLGVIQVEGRVFMRQHTTCPFAALSYEITQLGPCTAIVVDVHAEASSEKQALAWHFAGCHRIAALVGTHTHVPTADARILRGATAYLTDVGMTGPYDSVIGMATEPAIQRFLQPQSKPVFEVGSDNVRLCGVYIDIDEPSARATHIETVQEVYTPTRQF